MCIVLLLFLWDFVYLLDFQLLQNKFLKTTCIELPLILCQESDNYSSVGSTARDALVAWMVKNPSADAWDMGSIPGSGRSPGEGNGYPLQYSWLENPMGICFWCLYSAIDLCLFCTIVYSLANITVSDYCNFIMVLRSGSMSPPHFLFFSSVLAILYILLLYSNFRISL